MTTDNRRSGRSPGYPDIDLREAIDKARVLWDKEGRNLAPVATIQEHWGFKVNTGPGLRAVAALKKFGLLADRGRGDDRLAGLTELAFSIVLDQRENSTKRAEAIRKAALNPPIHSELWEQYKGALPSDATLQFILQKERKFSPRGADALIRELRATIEFAKLEYTEDIAEHKNELPDDGGSEDDELLPDPFATSPNLFEERSVAKDTNVTETRVLQLPLLGGTWAAVQIPQPMSEPDWDQMMAVLQAMKPGIVNFSGGNTRSPDSIDLYQSGD